MSGRLGVLIGLWAVFSTLLSACTPARHEIDGLIVKDIRFQGNGGLGSGHNNYQLRSQMRHNASAFGLMLWPLMYIVDPMALDERMLLEDAYRLEIWYAHHGWFDARFEGWRLRSIRPRRERRAGIVSVLGQVDPGPPSLVREYEITGLGTVLAPFGKTIKRTGELKSGEQFNLDVVRETEAELTSLLHHHGRAYATTEAALSAYPEEQAVDVELKVEPGILTRFGEITLEGLDKVPETLIRKRLRLQPGDTYDVATFGRDQSAIYRLQAFSLVTIRPDLSDPTVAEVPVTVSLTEAKFRRLRAGLGLNVENLQLQPHVSTGFRHTNLFRQLIRLELDAAAGLVSLPGALTSYEGGFLDGFTPIYSVSSSIAVPTIAGSAVSISLDGSYAQEAQIGLFPVRTPSLALATTIQPSDAVSISFGPVFEVYDYVELDKPSSNSARLDLVESGATSLFGSEFENPYVLTAFDIRTTFDWRDDPVDTTRGYFFAGGLRYGERLFDNGFRYLSLDGDWRVFRPIKIVGKGGANYPVTGVGRLKGKVLLPFSERGIPYPERAFLGGTSSVRSYRNLALGDYYCACVYSDTSKETLQRQYYLPVGGNIGLEANMEFRYHTTADIDLATFVDVGLLTHNLARVGLQDVRYGVGVGARYQSSLGPLRLDIAVRPRVYPEDNGPLDYLNCNDDDQDPRRMDLIQTIAPKTGFPIALQIFIAIGEAL